MHYGTSIFLVSCCLQPGLMEPQTKAQNPHTVTIEKLLLFMPYGTSIFLVSCCLQLELMEPQTKAQNPIN